MITAKLYKNTSRDHGHFS